MELSGKLRYKKKLTQEDIGKIVGASRVQVKKVLDAAKLGYKAVQNLTWTKTGRPPKAELPLPSAKHIRKVTC